MQQLCVQYHLICRAILLLLLACAQTLYANASLDLARMQSQMRTQFGQSGLESITAWQQMIRQAQGQGIEQQLWLVNDFFNRTILWEDDWVIWQQEDYWATPMETLGKRAGDCEDYSIAKYMSLRLLGVDNNKLRLIYVNAQVAGQSIAHMVLGYYPTPQASPIILDNINPQLLPAHQRPDLRPVFSFNDRGLWVGGATSPSAEPTSRLSRWGDVLQRMRQEGWQL